jgi:hypothetical protein
MLQVEATGIKEEEEEEKEEDRKSEPNFISSSNKSSRVRLEVTVRYEIFSPSHSLNCFIIRSHYFCSIPFQ